MDADEQEKQQEPTWAQRLAERARSAADAESAAGAGAEVGGSVLGSAPTEPSAAGEGEPKPRARRLSGLRSIGQRLAGAWAGLRATLRTPAARRRLRSGGGLLLAFLLGALAFGALTLSLGPDSALSRLLSGAAIGGPGPAAEVLPGLALALTADPDPVPAGGSVNYSLRLTNTGGVSLSLTVLDLLPAGAGVRHWTPILAPAAVWRQSFSVDVPADYHGVLTNAVWATTREGVTGAYTLTTAVADIPRLVIGQQARPDPVQAGRRLTYSLRVTNTGNIPLQAAIADVPPPQSVAAGSLDWEAALPPGGTWSGQLAVTVELGYAGPLVNRVEVTTIEGAEGTSTHTSAARVSPRLAVGQRAWPDPVQAGSGLTYTLAVTNTGNLALHAVVTDLLPAGVQPGGAPTWRTGLLPPGAVWSRTVPVRVKAGYAGLLTNVVQAAAGEGARAQSRSTVRSLAPGLEVAQEARPRRVQAGASLAFALVLTNTGNVPLHATVWDRLPARAISGEPVLWWIPVVAPAEVWTETVVVTTAVEYTGPLTNVVQVTSAEGAGGVCTATVQVRDSQLDLFVSARPDPVRAGSLLTYTLAVTNVGNMDLHATIENDLPSQVTPLATAAWPPVVLAPGAAWTQTVPVRVAPRYGGVLTSVLSVDTVEGLGGTYTATVFSMAPSLSLTQQVEPAAVIAGSPLTYTLLVTNNGNVDLHAVIVDVVPRHVTPTQGLLWWMTTIAAPGGTWQRTVVLTVEQGYAGPLTNVLHVRTFEGVSGTVTHTLGATSAITGLKVVNSSPTLLLRTTAFTATVQSGSDVTYLWNFGDGTPVLRRPPNRKHGVVIHHVYPAVGGYTAIVTATNSYGSIVATTRVEIFELSGHMIYLPLTMRSQP